MALNDTQKLRMHLVAGIVVLAFVAVLGRLYQIQCLDHKKYEKIAASQHYAKIPIPARRGRILDSRGTALAICLPADSLFADPPEVEQKGEAAWKLAPLLGLEPQEIFLKLIRESRFSWIKRTLPPEEADAVRKLRIRGLGFCREYRRGYPHASLMGQTIGFVGTGDVTDPVGIKGVAGVKGLAGLELTMQQYLAGVNGYRVAQRDAAGTSIASPDLKEIPAVNGLDVTLTIDANIQRIAEEEVLKTSRDWKPIGAVAVVMDPNTGDILALVNWPYFDPNTFATLKPDKLQKLSKNSAVLDTYEPGSTFKPFTMCGALEENVLNPNTVIDCESGVAIINRRRLRDTQAHHALTARQVMERSSNIGMAKIGLLLGPARLHQYISAFGFGTRAGLPIAGEEPGRLAPVAKWSGYTISSIPMGQEVAVTAVQLTAGYSAIAAGGKLMKPRLVKKVTNPDTGEVVTDFPPVMVRQVVSTATARAVTDMLVGVVEDAHGTGRRAQLDGYRVAGKTGTAQKAIGGVYSSTDYISSFVAFAPAYNPRICVLVKIDTPRGHSHYGGTVAAPAVREIIRRTLAYMDVPPDTHRLAKSLEPVGEMGD